MPTLNLTRRDDVHTVLRSPRERLYFLYFTPPTPAGARRTKGGKWP